MPETRRASPPSERPRHGKVPRVRSQSLLDLVDTLIDKGVALDAEVVLGLADIDLICIRVGALLAAADRVSGRRPAGIRSRGRRARVASQAIAQRAASPIETEPPPPPLSSPAGRMSLAVDRQSAASALPVATDDASRSVIRLVLTVVEFIRQLLERQAVRRVRERTLTPQEIERLGTALMQLEATVHELAERHGLDPADLNLDLGPLGALR